jgi:5'(3')-deoxyribonucleotidase
MRYQLNSPRKVIAVDLDEVLARTTLAIADFHNDTYGTSLTMDDFISYDFTKVWGGTREESIAKWRLFFDSPYFHKVEPVEGSLETLKVHVLCQALRRGKKKGGRVRVKERSLIRSTTS